VRAIFDFLVETRIMEFVTDPRVVFAAAALFLLSLFMRWKYLAIFLFGAGALVAALFLLSLFMRWKYLAIFLFGAGALVAVARYSKLAEGKASMDQNMLVFAIGTFLVAVVLIYFLFIRGD